MSEAHGDLIVALRALGEGLDVAGPAGSDPVSVAVRRIVAATPTPERRAAPARRRRPVVLVVAALVVAALVVVAVPGSRAALARWLGIGSVRIVTTDDPVPDLSGPYDLGEPVTVDAATARAPGPLVPDGLGPPAAAFVGAPTGAVTVVWPATDELPPIGTGPGAAGLVVTALPEAISEPLLTKVGSAGTVVEATTVDGRPAYWVAGALHVVRADEAEGGDVPDTVRLAGNTLLWADGDITYRLESGLDRDAAVAVAERIPRAPGGG